jgi:hypothetical protein
VTIVPTFPPLHWLVFRSHYAKDMKDAAAKALLGGCDVDLGDGLYSLVEVRANRAWRATWLD